MRPYVLAQRDASTDSLLVPVLPVVPVLEVGDPDAGVVVRAVVAEEGVLARVLAADVPAHPGHVGGGAIPRTRAVTAAGHHAEPARALVVGVVEIALGVGGFLAGLTVDDADRNRD